MEVLQRRQIRGIEASLLTVQLRQTGHAINMDDSLLTRWSSMASCSQGSDHSVDSKSATKTLSRSTLPCLTSTRLGIGHKSLTGDRTSWRALCHQSLHTCTQLRQLTRVAFVSLKKKRIQGNNARSAQPPILHHVSKNDPTLKQFWWYLAEIFKTPRTEFACFSLHVYLLSINFKTGHWKCQFWRYKLDWKYSVNSKC